MRRPLVTFENDFMETKEQLSADADGALGSITIDGYPADMRNGRVVCKIYLTETRKFIITWHESEYHMNPNVLGLIEESKQVLLDMYPENDPVTKIYCDMPCSFSENGFCTNEAIAIGAETDYPGVGICNDYDHDMTKEKKDSD